MDEPPVRVMAQIGRVVETAVEEAVEEHERRCHALPPIDNSPLSSIPYADYRVSDDEMSHMLELLDDCDEVTVAHRTGIPVIALRRLLADWERRYGRFLYMRRSGIG